MNYYGKPRTTYTRHPSFGLITADEAAKLATLTGDEKTVLIHQIAQKQKERQKQMR